MNERDASGTSAKKELQAIRIFFIAILVGAAGFLFVSLFLGKVVEVDRATLGKFENGLIGFLAITCIFAHFYARKIYNERLVAAKNSLITLRDKLNIYRAALIMYVALYEGAVVFGIILFVLTSNYIFTVMSAVMVLLILSRAPTNKRVMTDLELDWEEQQELQLN